MKLLSTITLALLCMATTINGQTIFDEELQMPAGYNPNTVLLPPSPLSLQVLFVGQTDMVQTTPTYGNPATEVPAKEWHDFIGFTPDNSGQSLGWVSVNHEMQLSDDFIGDGGGMTVFRVTRDPATDQLIVMEQTLSDGRTGKFFNVDFVNTVGITGMNCAGITSLADGRIWTAEEWAVGGNGEMASWSRDTSDFTIGVGTANGLTAPNGFPGFNGETVKSYENLNWMVEIDPKEAKAIRKQYNWGRQPFEGGVILPDNQTVYLGVDDTPGYFTKFVADTPGDFTSGKTFVYSEDATNHWIEIDNTDLDNMLDIISIATENGATMYSRIEWVTYDAKSNRVFFAETGRDKPGSRFAAGTAAGATLAQHHQDRAAGQGTSATDGAYWDYYGRVMQLDCNTDEVSVLIEGGPYFEESPAEADYPSNHLSSPDGIHVMTIDNQSFLVIQEDLNGTSYGRMPAGVSNRTCEMYLLDLSIDNPTVNDLIRLTAVPTGAEVTGAISSPDGKSLLFNAQHPSSSNPFPYNHSLTMAIHGFDKLTVNDLKPAFSEESTFQIFPNPTSQSLHFNKVADVAIYAVDGKRMKVYRGVKEIDLSEFEAGIYFLQNASGQIEKLIIQK